MPAQEMIGISEIVPLGPYERMVELEERIEFLEDALAVARAEAINDGTSWTLEEVKDRQARGF
jgi:hypothetical protein